MESFCSSSLSCYSLLIFNEVSQLNFRARGNDCTWRFGFQSPISPFYYYSFMSCDNGWRLPIEFLFWKERMHVRFLWMKTSDFSGSKSHCSIFAIIVFDDVSVFLKSFFCWCNLCFASFFWRVFLLHFFLIVFVLLISVFVFLWHVCLEFLFLHISSCFSVSLFLFLLIFVRFLFVFNVVFCVYDVFF